MVYSFQSFELSSKEQCIVWLLIMFGAHGLAGFIESFSRQYICRFCTAQKVDIQSKDVHSGAFSLWTKEIHDAHLTIAQDTETSCWEVKQACPLTEHLQQFHVSTGHLPDIVHYLFEGIVPLELAQCLSILISKKSWFASHAHTQISFQVKRQKESGSHYTTQLFQ